jgi:hypothetical protein
MDALQHQLSFNEQIPLFHRHALKKSRAGKGKMIFYKRYSSSESTTSSTEFGERGQNCDQQCPKPFHLFAVIAAGR